MLGYADYVFTTVFTIEIILKVNLLTNVHHFVWSITFKYMSRHFVVVHWVKSDWSSCEKYILYRIINVLMAIFVLYIDDSVWCFPSSRLLLQKCFQSLGSAGRQCVSNIVLSAVSATHWSFNSIPIYLWTNSELTAIDSFISSSIINYSFNQLAIHPCILTFVISFLLLQFKCHLCGKDSESTASAQTSPGHQPCKRAQGMPTVIILSLHRLVLTSSNYLVISLCSCLLW